MIALLQRRAGLRRLFVANAISMLGDWLTYVAVGVLALGGGTGLVDVALVQLAHTVPQVASAPLAGWLADRVDRRALVMGASVVRGLLTAAMAVAAARGEIEVVEALLFARMAGASFVTTPTSALLPRLVEPDEIAEANAMLGLAWAVIFSIGVALGGVLSAVVGPVTALGLDAITFFVAAAIVATLRVPPARPEARRAEGSLLADARRHPSRLFTAMLKLPAQLVSGAAFVAMHGIVAVLAPDHVALALGALHMLRGIGNGLAPLVLRARMSAHAMAAIGSVVAIAGCATMAAAAWLGGGAGAIACAAGAALVWGAGVGASWVGGGASLQRAVPDAVLGRYSALDLTAAALASAIGGVACASITSGVLAPPLSVAATLALVAAAAGAVSLLVHGGASRALALATAGALVVIAWPSALPSPAATQDAEGAGEWLAAELRARAIDDRDFVRTELWTWTSREQADRLAAGDAPLLSATADDGALRSPYQVSLDRLAREGGDEGAIASLLTSHAALAARRYAWTTPYGTVLPLGRRSYGTALIRMALRDDAWHLRFAPDERPRLRAVGARGEPIALDAVRASPERIASVFHVRRRGPQGAFREVVVHGGVASWAGDARVVGDRIAADRRVLEGLRAGCRERPRCAPRPLAPFWSRPLATGADPIALYAATMPFDRARHRATEATLAAMIDALDPAAPRE